ncbi:MAG: hypothetical protein KC420_00455 [Myxococcales bacterium]|nr:hypothetical protein [Myxococcales bacterium]MCB9705092.1 hypothetical protein [Myxococcales bacterium]
MRWCRRRAGGWLVAIAALGLVSGCYHGDFIELACDRQGTCIGSATEATGTSTGSSGETSSGSSTTAIEAGLDAYRLTKIEVADPHFYYDFGGCKDVTDLLNFSVNDEIGSGGISFVLLFDPADPELNLAPMILTDGECVVGVDKTTCGYKNPDFKVSTVANNSADVACDAVVPGTTNPNYPQPNVAAPTCFTSPRGTVILPPLVAALPPMVLYDAQIVGSYGSPTAPVDTLVSGLITGFIPQSQAEQIEGMIQSFPFNMWGTVAGGASCQVDVNAPIDDTDPNPNPDLTERGVWIYLNFVAERVEWID